MKPRKRADQAITERRIIAENVNRKMLEAGFSNTRLAELTGCDPSLISSIRNGGANPTLVTLVKIARALQVQVQELLVLQAAPRRGRRSETVPNRDD